MCSVMKENFAFDFSYTERSFFTLNTSLKKKVAFSRGKVTEASFLYTEHFTKKNVAFSRGKITEGSLFSVSTSMISKFQPLIFWGERGVTCSVTLHEQINENSLVSVTVHKSNFLFCHTKRHHEQAATFKIDGLQSNEDENSRFWISKLFHDDEK